MSRILIAIISIGLYMLLITSNLAYGKVPNSGYFLTEDGSGIVRLVPCGKRICGTLVWAKGIQAGDSDVANPNPAKRTRSLCGITILEFDKSGGNARAYNPESGIVETGFNISITDKIMYLGGESGEHWKRVSAPKTSCQDMEARARPPLSGFYYVQDKSVIIKLKPCKTQICGHLVWGRNLEPGEVDPRNRKTLCDMIILKFERNGKNGWAYDPETGKTERQFRVVDHGTHMALGGSEGEKWPRAEKPDSTCS